MNTNQPTKYLIVVLGATASGKTALAIDLANHYGGAILSSDSRQFFKEMSIGTAKPTPEELAAAPHHFVDSLSIHQDYTIGAFERDGLAFLEQYYQQKNTAILAGGAGMYIKAICQGLDDFPKVDKAIRVALNEQLETVGITSLQQELQQLDPVYYEKVDQQNPQRLIRALEICRGTGQPFSYFQAQNTARTRPFEVIKIGIDWERSALYDRINRRVDLMLEQGLLAEAKALYPYRTLNALQTVGYQEFFDYFDGNITLDKAIELVKRNSRRYAKRQLTWFRKDTNIIWVKPKTPLAKVVEAIELQKTKC